MKIQQINNIAVIEFQNFYDVLIECDRLNKSMTIDDLIPLSEELILLIECWERCYLDLEKKYSDISEITYWIQNLKKPISLKLLNTSIQNIKSEGDKLAKKILN